MRGTNSSRHLGAFRILLSLCSLVALLAAASLLLAGCGGGGSTEQSTGNTDQSSPYNPGSTGNNARGTYNHQDASPRGVTGG